jgi:short-subunit dehydrogenase
MDRQKHVLITGGSEGIGLELAKLFAKDGYNLILVARDQEKLQQAAEELKQAHNVTVHTIVKNLMQSDGPPQVYQEVRAKGIAVDVLVNNAGQGVYGRFVDNELQKELDIIQLNISATVMLTKYFLKDMLQQNKGKILNVGSIAGEMPGPWQAVYHGTKAFIHSWSEGLRNELQDSAITITILVPGATDTAFFDKAGMKASKIYEEPNLADPVKVARDGYEGLMKGEHKVVSGLKNKAMVGLSQVMPDPMVAENMRKQQEPKEKE